MSTRPSRGGAVLAGIAGGAALALLMGGLLLIAQRGRERPAPAESTGAGSAGPRDGLGLARSAQGSGGRAGYEKAAEEESDPTLASLIRRLRSPELGVRADALVRLRTLGPRGAPAAPHILDILKEGDPRLDGLVAITLAALGPVAIEAIESALASEDPRVRAGAISSLGRIERLTPRSVVALRQALGDADDSVRAAAATAWARHPEDAAGEGLAGLRARLEDASPRVRAAAACTLGKLGLELEETVDAISRLAARPGEVDAVRLEAVWALIRLGSLGAGGSTTLVDAAVDGSPDVRREALRGLTILGAHAAQAAPHVLEEVGRLGPQERGAWVRVLAAIAPERDDVTAVLVESLWAGDGAAGAAVEGLVRAGERGSSLLRGAAEDRTAREVLEATTVRWAEGEGGKGTRAALERLVSDSSEVLSELALRSLATAGEEAAESVGIVAAAMGQVPVERWAAFARTIGEIGRESPAAAEALLEAAKRGDHATRIAAIRGLGYVGVSTVEIEAHLNAAAGATDAVTSREARRALARLGGTQSRRVSVSAGAPPEGAEAKSDR